MNRQEYRIAIYQILADALKEPSTEPGEEPQESGDFLFAAFEALQYPIAPEKYQLWSTFPCDISRLQQNYCLSFIYPVESRVLPVESIYRQWTLDNTSEMPFAKEKGYLMSDFALHMQALYAQYQLSIPAEYTSMPDHLCLELEFCAFLIENASREEQAIFINEHLNWVDELYLDAVKQDIPIFYRQVIQVIAEFLKNEMQSS